MNDAELQEILGLTLRHDFALVLLDAQMSGLDGFETAALMRQSGRSCQHGSKNQVHLSA